MDMDNDDEPETDGAETTGRHKIGDSTASGSGCRASRKSHIVMPPLVPDSEDQKIVIKPTCDM
jgi:hypothetical protein